MYDLINDIIYFCVAPLLYNNKKYNKQKINIIRSIKKIKSPRKIVLLISRLPPALCYSLSSNCSYIWLSIYGLQKWAGIELSWVNCRWRRPAVKNGPNEEKQGGWRKMNKRELERSSKLRKHETKRKQMFDRKWGQINQWEDIVDKF